MAAVKPVGPGPGAYALPSTVGHPAHDPSRFRAPMYSFGARQATRLGALGPGPAYRIDRVTREGIVTAPAWSFGSRFEGRARAGGPGPGAHAPERCPLMKEQRAPAYSMGARLGMEAKRIGPAPNAYALRSCAGGPAYTMGGRKYTAEKSKSPGPAVYYQRCTDVYMPRLPIYSLGARTGGVGGRFASPGPAAYPPQLYNTKKAAYSFSFGTKHNPYSPPMIIKEDEMDCLP